MSVWRVNTSVEKRLTVQTHPKGLSLPAMMDQEEEEEEEEEGREEE